MKATILLLVFAMAVAVTAQVQDEYTPAIMTPAPSTLKKPIIFAPAPPAGTTDADAPLFGAPPTNLKKANISENIYGGVVEFAKGRDGRGCRCRKQLPEKYRYDAQFKKDVVPTTPCGCPIVAPKPEDKLPPVIARLYPVPKNTTNTTAPCPKPEPVVVKIAPKYYPKRQGPRALARAAAAAALAANCTKPAPAPVHITPKFYPTRSERRARRRARRAKKAAAKKL
jgi:hypothetical protein